MDNLILLSVNEDDRLKNLKIVLNTANRTGLTINWRKNCFLRRTIEFLRHVVKNI